MWGVWALSNTWQRSRSRSTAQHAEANRGAVVAAAAAAAGARAQKEEKREKQNTCLYVCSIYPPFPIIVSIWETARKIMKQSFVNINSFTSQKKIVIFCFCFTKLEKKKTNRQRKVFKSLVICNYASKKATTNHTNTQSNRTNREHKHEHFLFLFDAALTCFFVRAWEKNSCNSSSSATFMGFSFSCHWKKGCDRQQHQQVSSADWFHFLFEIFRLSHTMFTHKNRLFQNVKRKILKKKPNCIILRLCVPSNTKN